MSNSPSADPLVAPFASALAALSEKGQRRELLPIAARSGPLLQLEGRWLVNFSSNDYLGLSDHAECIAAAADFSARFGCSAQASRVVTGGLPPHDRLEQRLCEVFGTSGALLFPSGYQANVGSVTAMVGRGDHVFSDARNHASLVDGCRLSRATIHVYRHGDIEDLSRQLATCAPGNRRLIVSDTVFSMEGDKAPVAALAALAREHAAILLLDEAHAIGVLGPRGTGLGAACSDATAIRIGTFSKALGGHGAFAVTSGLLRDFLINHARAFMYTTALPPGVVGGNLAALEIAARSDGAARRARVLTLAERLRHALQDNGLSSSGSGTPIVALSFPGASTAGRIAAQLRVLGQLVWPFRPPTVPRETSLLRMCLSAAHTEAQVDELGAALMPCIRNYTISP